MHRVPQQIHQQPDVLFSTFVLFQTIQYITKNKVMETESRELAAVSRGKIKVGSTDDWKSEQLFVPPLPPTNLRGCHLIRIQYDVFVSLESSQHHHQSEPHSSSFHKIGLDNKTHLPPPRRGGKFHGWKMLKPCFISFPVFPHYILMSSPGSLHTESCHKIRMLHIFGSWNPPKLTITWENLHDSGQMKDLLNLVKSHFNVNITISLQQHLISRVLDKKMKQPSYFAFCNISPLLSRNRAQWLYFATK